MALDSAPKNGSAINRIGSLFIFLGAADQLIGLAPAIASLRAFRLVIVALMRACRAAVIG